MTLSKKKIRSDFNRAAQNYEQFATLQRKVAEKLTKFGWPIFDQNGLVVDVGCGTGFIKQILKSANILQIDISEKMCRKAQEFGQAITGDMENLPIQFESVDGIISSLTLQWANDVDLVFDEFNRVLKKGAPFILSTFGSHTLQELKSIFRMLDPHVHVNNFFGPEELMEKAHLAGFTNLAVKVDSSIKEYKDVMELMYTMKHIGANNKSEARKKTFHGKDYFKKLDSLYRGSFGHSTMLPATWEVIYLKGFKE